jgi:PKD repeat protein
MWAIVRRVGAAAAVICVLLAAPAGAFADVGYQGQSYSGTGTPTGTKRAENVMWWNDGSWWAHMWDSVSQDFHIFRLDLATQHWLDTGVTVETRPNTHSDVLWDGAHLYVASHEFVGENLAAVAGSPSLLFRLTYDPVGKTYLPDPGYPATINNYKTETLVIDKDSTGKLWATWPQDGTIYMNRTVADDLNWGTPFQLPGAGTGVTLDDNSAVVAFGNKIGVMWSNQTSSEYGMWFAVHEDGQPDDAWGPSHTAIQGSGTADDHMSLKADSGGRVYAGIKTNHTTGTAPLFRLLVRDPATGAWTSHTVARVSDCPTRPMIMIDEENAVVHAYATYPSPPDFVCDSNGGAIHEKTSPLGAISFPEGVGTPVIEDSDSSSVNNVSSTKQTVDSTTGIALLAVNTTTRRYWHNFLPIAPPIPEPPIADFTATPTSGTAPLPVTFSDASTGEPTGWSWDFGDGATSTDRNPTHTYTTPGVYTVSLTASNSDGSDTETRVGYVNVTAPPSFSLSPSPGTRTIVRGASTTYQITVAPTGGFSGPVDLSLSGLPSGTSAGFSANPVVLPGTGSSTLTVRTTSFTPIGHHVLTITASNGALTRTTTVRLHVKR